MAILPGTNSYITVAEADAHIASHYRSGSKPRQRWNGVAEEDKEILLVQACAAMEELPFHGRKAITGQPLAFPRLPMQYGVADGAPEKVKAAQAELALWLSDEDERGADDRRHQLQDAGVTSFSVGDLSESYAAGTGSSSAPGSEALRCPKCRILLAGYIAGSIETC